MRFDIEELVEDVFYSYLSKKLPTGTKAYIAFDIEQLQYPAIVIGVTTHKAITETEELNSQRVVDLKIGVLTEGITEKTTAGKIVKSAREANRSIRKTVMELLTVSGLVDILNGIGLPNVIFSMAQIGTPVRDVDEEKRLLITEIPIEVIAAT
jgi:hypothetical protein